MGRARSRERGTLVGRRDRPALVGRHVVAYEAGVRQKPVLLSPGFQIVRTSRNRIISAGNRSHRDVAAAIAPIPSIPLPRPRRPAFEPSGSICVPAFSQGEATDFYLIFLSSIDWNGQNIAADGVI